MTKQLVVTAFAAVLAIAACTTGAPSSKTEGSGPAPQTAGTSASSAGEAPAKPAAEPQAHAEGTKAAGSAAPPASVVDAAKAIGRDAKAIGQDVAVTAKQAWELSAQTVTGVVTKVDGKARTITVKTKDGAERVYEVSEDAVVSIGRASAKAGKQVGTSVKTGAEVTVHYVAEGGKNVARAVAHKQ